MSPEQEFWTSFGYDHKLNQWVLKPGLEPMEILEVCRKKLEADREAVEKILAKANSWHKSSCQDPECIGCEQQSWDLPDSPKMLRETLCVAQTYVSLSGDYRTTKHHIERLQWLIDLCDIHRPLGPDGRHGDRHTPTCGCD